MSPLMHRGNRGKPNPPSQNKALNNSFKSRQKWRRNKMSVPDSQINVTDKDSTQTIGPTNTHLSSLPTPSLTPC